MEADRRGVLWFYKNRGTWASGTARATVAMMMKLKQDAVHACDPSTWWRQENQELKAVFGTWWVQDQFLLHEILFQEKQKKIKWLSITSQSWDKWTSCLAEDAAATEHFCPNCRGITTQTPNGRTFYQAGLTSERCQWSGDGFKLNKWKELSSEVQGPGLALGWSKHIILKNTTWKLKLHSFWFCSVLFLAIECYFLSFGTFTMWEAIPALRLGLYPPSVE